MLGCRSISERALPNGAAARLNDDRDTVARCLVGENLERWMCLPVGTYELTNNGSHHMLKFLGSTIGIIFLIGLIVVIGLFALIF